jgi:hypothetical protein
LAIISRAAWSGDSRPPTFIFVATLPGPKTCPDPVAKVQVTTHVHRQRMDRHAPQAASNFRRRVGREQLSGEINQA